MRRLLFVRRSRNARRAPAYLALVALAALGLVGLGSVTSAPQEPPAAPSKAVEPEPSAGKAYDGGQQVPLPLQTPGRRSHWM